MYIVYHIIYYYIYIYLQQLFKAMALGQGVRWRGHGGHSPQRAHHPPVYPLGQSGEARAGLRPEPRDHRRGHVGYDMIINR